MRISDWSSDVCSSDLTARNKVLPSCLSLVEAAEDRDRRDAVERRAAEIVRQPEIDLRELPIAGAAAKLVIDLIGHAQARGAHRMAEAFEPAVGLARDSAAEIIFAVENVKSRAARIRQARI